MAMLYKDNRVDFPRIVRTNGIFQLYTIEIEKIVVPSCIGTRALHAMWSDIKFVCFTSFTYMIKSVLLPKSCHIVLQKLLGWFGVRLLLAACMPFFSAARLHLKCNSTVQYNS